MTAIPREPAVVVQGLTKRFGRVLAVHDVDLTVTQGETVVLWGANGAGKTTLLRCLLGLLPFEGVAQVLGLDVRAQGKTVRSRIGYVPQDVRLPAEVSVRETVAFFARLRGVPLAEGAQLLAHWQLAEAASQQVRALSGGMKQRLAVVLALLGDPPILLLDEPTSHLDAQARRDLSDVLEQLKRQGKTMVCCLHRVGEAWKLADRLVLLEAGRKMREGAPGEILGALSEGAVVTMTVPREDTDRAAALLAASGLTVARNGMQLWVTVPAGRKVEPIRRLLDAGIEILDMEVGDGR
jgi:ABC-type multidrug transport system ATPase subunit